MQYPKMSPGRRVAALASALEVDLARNVRYPAWYLRHRHFLPDGYLSGMAARFYQGWVARLYDLPNPGVIRRSIAEMARDRAPRRILEIGCGTGNLLAELAREHRAAQIVGIDLSPFLLDHAQGAVNRQGARAELHHADAAEFDSSEPYDTVIAAHLFGHIPRTHAQAVFANVRKRLLAPGGVLHVIEHRWHEPRWHRDTAPASTNHLTPLLVHRQYTAPIA